MKYSIFIILTLFLFGCNKPKTVYICGDHVCINKSEAKQYFENNLSLEVKVISKNKNKDINLVELNMNRNLEGNKKISITKKNKTEKTLKVLSNDEIKRKKAELKLNKIKKNKDLKEKKIAKKKSTKSEKIKNKIKKQNTSTNQVKKIVDICTILKDCNIDEISKYLIEQGKSKKFPDITTRE